ncbi:anucleate primary sterigmata protein a [Acrodontium crateriforme]|uniref:Anucleate primary sterigmata protein a n=1 Tax=Acrodontium crateriforme TaxID=150365 RepID=A0AAQ3R9D7_9PEZI|nr:anucleate primary sterigmata protein a [Acrodontium crateriforme]
MGDYFKEYSSFVGAKGMPSPADTPYETPAFIRAKRSSRVNATPPRGDSPPPAAPTDDSEYKGRPRDSRNSPIDPRRFTPTLHASLVSEILNLRRELDSKNSLVENLEESLESAKTENDAINEQLTQQAKELRKSKQQVQQMEKGTYDAVEELAKERDSAVHSVEELKMKLEAANKKTRLQDEDAVRTQGIWEQDKESWENERRQLERRVHVTETRLRKFVDEMTAQQAALQSQNVSSGEIPDDKTFKDSALGNESDEGSVRSTVLSHHRRNMSSMSSPAKSIRGSASFADMSDLSVRPQGHSLADELVSDPEDEENDEDDHHSEEDHQAVDEQVNDETESPGSAVSTLHTTDTTLPIETKAVLDDDALPDSPTIKSPLKPVMGVTPSAAPPMFSINGVLSEANEISSVRNVATRNYMDRGYQPSPPPSPLSKGTSTDFASLPLINEPVPVDENEHEHTHSVASSLGSVSVHGYSTAATQTESDSDGLLVKTASAKHDSLEPPGFVPAIAIHPPASRPSSPRPYVLPPGTKNASTQANIRPTYVDASMQTGEIRVDKRPPKIPQEYLRARRLPSKPQTDSILPARPPTPKSEKRKAIVPIGKIYTNVPPMAAPPSPPLQSPVEDKTLLSRDNSSKDLRSLRAIPLPRPVLAPPAPPTESTSHGHLNRAAQYGVTRPAQSSSRLAEIDNDTDTTDYEDDMTETERKDMASSFNKAPHGRFGLSQPPKVVPEDKEISPERRPDTAGSYGAAPAPSVSSSRAASQKARGRPSGKLNSYKDLRSRSPSFTSLASSSLSTQSGFAIPPFPIPVRSSSYFKPQTHSEGSQSPTPNNSNDTSGDFPPPPEKSGKVSPNRLRKVQSAAAMRNNAVRSSPVKSRRRRRSPTLTPVQSTAYETAEPTKFPIPSLPTPLEERHADSDMPKGSVDLSKQSVSTMSESHASNEVNLVDAIAATMVGEWMFKYIRKRKSFGIGDDSDVQHQGFNGTVSVPAHGTRHKRWVWLSPYERTIMWDNKQPTSGAALMGKKGRKLVIESVLDVLDHTPMPKGAGLDSAFRRSILILTPARALKFTTVNKERHALWMTALSFLAQSGALPTLMPDAFDEPAPPPSSRFESNASDKRSRSPSFGKATTRSAGTTRSRRPTRTPDVDDTLISPDLFSQDQDTGAEPPAIPRLHSSTMKHQRKRSNTNPALPPTIAGFRSFSSNAVPSSNSPFNRLQLATSANHGGDLRGTSSKSAGSRQESLISSAADRPNFFEAMGTVRMEAFVDPGYQQGVRYIPGPPAGATLSADSRRRRGDSNLSLSTMDKRRTGYVFDEAGLDPFKGF